MTSDIITHKVYTVIDNVAELYKHQLIVNETAVYPDKELRKQTYILDDENYMTVWIKNNALHIRAHGEEDVETWILVCQGKILTYFNTVSEKPLACIVIHGLVESSHNRNI